MCMITNTVNMENFRPWTDKTKGVIQQYRIVFSENEIAADD